MAYPTHPRLETIFAITEGLESVARELIRAAAAQIPRERRRRGSTLRPGSDAPLWGALAKAVKPHLRERGEQAQLARILGVHPSRVSQYFAGNSAMPDAERTLLLLQWLALRRAGKRPG